MRFISESVHISLAVIDIRRSWIFLLLTHQKGQQELFVDAFYDAFGMNLNRTPSYGLQSTHSSIYQDREEFEHSVIMACESLVELYDASSDKLMPFRRIRFIHHSTLEFFKAQGRTDLSRQSNDSHGAGHIFTHEILAEAELASVSISYLLTRLPSGPLSGNMFEDVSPNLLEKDYPFLRYASQYWPQHLVDMIEGLYHSNDLPGGGKKRFDQATALLSQLLFDKMKLMVWLEALYRLLPTDWHQSTYDAILRWRATLSVQGGEYSQVISDLFEFLQDLSELHRSWSDALHAKPCEIWQDVTAFTQSRFLVRTSAVEVQKIGLEGPKESTRLSSRPLCKISQPETDGKLMAALTIWPSK